MRVPVLINPASGPGVDAARGRRRAALAAQVLAQEGVDAEVWVLQQPGEGFERARAAAARGMPLVLAWGGDGTVNAVGRGLAFSGTALGIVPGGSGNGLARELGLPEDPARALRTVLRAPERTLDAGEIGGRWFFNVAGIGLDARVAAAFNARGSARGLLSYLGLAARELRTYRAEAYVLDTDGAPLRITALFLACANAPQWGNGVRVAPEARPDDGMLDLVVVEERPMAARLWAAGRLVTGRLPGTSGVRRRRFAHLVVTGERTLTCHADGEPFTADGPLVVRVLPGALRVRAVPREPRPEDPGPR